MHENQPPMPPADEGKKLKELLHNTRRQQLDLANAAKVSKVAVYRWVRLPAFSDRVWPKIRDGLIALGLNPNEIRPESGTKIAQEDLVRLVIDWPDEHLRALQTIMTSDIHSRENLLSFISGALRPRP